MYNLIRRIDSLLIRLAIFIFRPKSCLDVIDPQSIKKILCLKLWGLGNLAVIYPLLYKVKRRLPEARVTFITFDSNKGFLEKNETLEEIVYLKLTVNPFLIIKQFIGLVVRFRRQKVDLLINFETFNNASALFSYLTGARVRIGFNNKYEGVFYTHPVENNPAKHISGVYSDLLGSLEIDLHYQYFNFKEQTERESKKVYSLLRKCGADKFICVHPGTSINFVGKRYREEHLSAMVDLLIDRYDLPIFFTGTQSEKETIGRIIGRISNKKKVIDLAGCLSLWEFMELMKRSFLLISSDTGPVHLAASLGVNTAAFYGPTSPQRYGPQNANSVTFYKDFDCSPCVGVDYLNRECKRGFRCLDFAPGEVFKKISELFFNE